MANSGPGGDFHTTSETTPNGSLRLDNQSTLFRSLPQQPAHFRRQPSQTAKPIVQHGGNYAVWTDNHSALLTEDRVGEPLVRVKHMYLDSWISKNIRVMACTGFVRAKEESTTCKKCGYTQDMHRYGDEVKERSYNKYIGTAPCNTYGLLDFQGIGVVNQAPYCRLSPTTTASVVHRLLLYQWKLPTPTLIISVLGGTGDFELQPKVKQAIKNGLVKAAETTGAWIITNGLNCGASKEVGSALKNAFKRNNRIPCIGITPWGIVQGRENLIGPDQKVRYYSRKAEVGKLNAHHSHFLLADNGLFTCKGAEVRLRRNLERYISGRQTAPKPNKLDNQPNRKSAQQDHSIKSGNDNADPNDITQDDPKDGKDNNLSTPDEIEQKKQLECKENLDDSPKMGDPGAVAKLPEAALAPKIPLVCVAIEGGVSLIRTMVDYLSEDPPVPIVVCDGTGKAADIISFAHRVYDERTRSIPDTVRAELVQTMHLTFNISADEANNLIKELELCFHLRQDYISIYSYGSQGDGVSDVDVKILSALLHSHTASPLERFHLTMSWGRPDLAENEIFRVGKSHPTEWSVSDVSEALMSAFCQDRVDFVKLLLHNGVDVQKFLTFRALEQLYNSTRTPNSMLAKLLKEVKSKSQTEDSQAVSLIDIGSIIEMLIGGVYRSAYCRKLFKIKYREYKTIEEEENEKNNNKKNGKGTTAQEKIQVPGLRLRRVSTRLISNASFKSLTEQVKQLEEPEDILTDEVEGKRNRDAEPTEYIFEFPFHELFLWAVLAERQEMAKFLWEQSPEPLAKAITGAKMYFTMSEEAEKDDSDLGSAETLRQNGEEFLELALSLIEECYSIDTCQTGHLLTYELQQWSKQTNLSMAVHAGAKTFVSHNSCQSLINDLWMGGLKSNKNSNFKVIACILCFPLLFLMEYKTVEELRLMPQTAEEHADEDPEHYDTDSTSTTSTSSSSSSDNDGVSTAAEDGVGEHRVWGRLKRLKRRRHKSTTSAATASVAHPTPTTNTHIHNHEQQPEQQQQIVLQGVKNDGSVVTESLSVSNGRIRHNNKATASLSNRVPLDVASNLEEHFLSSMTGKGDQDVPVVTKASSRVKINALGTIIKEKNGGGGGDSKSVVSWGTRGSNREIAMMKKLYEFFNAPIVKFWIHTMAFFLFLTFYHWMILVRLPEKPHWTEVYVIAWVLSMCMEVCREIVVSEPVKFRAKVSVWLSDPWNIIDFLGCLLFLIAMPLRFNPSTMSWGRWLYCLDVIFWYAKLLEVFSVNKSLGPFVQIIAQMMLDMISFMVFMFLVLTCYGTVRQSILNPNEPFKWENIRDIFFHPYFMIYGEVYAAEIAPECGTEHTPECVTGHWIEPALMSVYLLVENILLVNLLIAVFNNTYNQVRSMTKEVWKYQRYYVIMHHETKPFVPPPLTLLAYISILGRWLFKRHKLHAYDKGLKLFLSREEELELNKFEERCLANFLRKREHHARQSTQERIKLIDERTEVASSNFVDLNEKVTANRTSLQGLELQLEELNRLTCEKLDMMFAMMQTMTTQFHNNIASTTVVGCEGGDGNGDLAPDRTLTKETNRQVVQDANNDLSSNMDYPDAGEFDHNSVYQNHQSVPIQRQASQPNYKRAVSQPFNRMLSVNVGHSASINNPLRASQSISNSGLFLNQSCPSAQAFSVALRNAAAFRERDYTSITDHIESHLLVNNENSETSLVANKGNNDDFVEQNAEATQWLAVTHFIRKKLRTYSTRESRKKARLRRRKRAAMAAAAAAGGGVMDASPFVRIEIGVASDDDDDYDGNDHKNNNNNSEGRGGDLQTLRGTLLSGDTDLDYDEEVDNEDDYDDDEPFDDDDFGFDLYDEEEDDDPNLLNGSSEVSIDEKEARVDRDGRGMRGASSELGMRVSIEGRGDGEQVKGEEEEGSDHEGLTLSQMLSSNSTSLLQRAFKDQIPKPRSSNSHHRSSTSSNETAPRSPNTNPLLVQGDTFELMDSVNMGSSSAAVPVPIGLTSRSNMPSVLSCLVEENNNSSTSV